MWITETPGDGIAGIVFDAVGTLIEPRPSVADVYRAAARRQGVSLEQVEVRGRFRRHFRNDEVDEARGPLVTDETLERRRWRRIVGSVLAEVPDPDRAFAELWDHFASPTAWSTFPDVGPTLHALRAAGVPVRVASNFDARLRAVAAGLPDLAPLRGSLVISSEVGVRKPHPDFYLAACRSLGLPPSRVLCVGDDPENDVAGAVRAGLRGVLIDRDNTGAAGSPRVADLGALVPLLVPGPAGRSRGESSAGLGKPGGPDR